MIALSSKVLAKSSVHIVLGLLAWVVLAGAFMEAERSRGEMRVALRSAIREENVLKRELSQDLSRRFYFIACLVSVGMVLISASYLQSQLPTMLKAPWCLISGFLFLKAVFSIG